MTPDAYSYYWYSGYAASGATPNVSLVDLLAAVLVPIAIAVACLGVAARRRSQGSRRVHRRPELSCRLSRRDRRTLAGLERAWQLEDPALSWVLDSMSVRTPPAVPLRPHRSNSDERRLDR